jgi:hypothetical protein
VSRGHRDARQPGGDNTLIGADARFATSTFRGAKNLAVEMFLLGSDAAGTRGTAGGIRLDYPNDRWDVAVNWRQIASDFQPALGFVPRAGIRKADVSIAFQPRPDRWGIRQVFFEVNPVVITDVRNRLESASLSTTPFNIRTESGEHFEWDVVPQFERLDEPFAVADGVTIPLGDYWWTRFRGEANTATKRAWVIDAATSWGGFYGGTLRQIEIGVIVKAGTHVSLSARTERDNGSLPQGRFSTDLFTLRADYNFTANLSWANLVQFDNASRIAGIQSRVRWILQPGNDLFLVINRGWERTLDGDRFDPIFDQDSAKLQYTFRF